MSISYCLILGMKEKIPFAESSKSSNKYKLEIKSLYNEIFSNITNDQLSIDNKNMFTFKKTKEIVILVVSEKNIDKTKPFTFLDYLKKKIELEHKSIKKLIENFKENKTEFCLQEKLENIIEDSLKYFNSNYSESIKEITEINKNVVEIKEDLTNNIKKQIKNIDDLEKPLVTASKINDFAKEFKKKSDDTLDNTRCCCNRKMKIIYLCLGSLVLLFGIYIIISFSICGSLNAFCVK